MSEAMFTKIAPAPEPFRGKPVINAPLIYGASPEKPFLWKIPAFGKRPLKFSADNLPDGLTLGDDGIITGAVAKAGEYSVTLRVSNALGADEKTVRIIIGGDGVLRTPLLGFTTWNAFRAEISDEKIRETARLVTESGLADCGYTYINIDSGWQGGYDGTTNTIKPNDRFPDMKALAAELHRAGLKIGIYSTPMLKAWGGPDLPGGTRGEPDPRYEGSYYGIGKIHTESEHAKVWSSWDFDYLKYDWLPTDTDNAELMRAALKAVPRDFGYCITVRAAEKNDAYWRASCSSWRDNDDSDDIWENVRDRRFCDDSRAANACPGHFYDLDMLEAGHNGGKSRLTKDEQLVSFTIRAIFPSPIQISMPVALMDEFDRAVLMNTEVLAVNQDPLCAGASCVLGCTSRDDRCGLRRYVKVYRKPLADGTYAIGIFNLGEEAAAVSLVGTDKVRDLWAREDIAGGCVLTLPPHTVRLLKTAEKPEIRIQ